MVHYAMKRKEVEIRLSEIIKQMINNQDQSRRTCGYGQVIEAVHKAQPTPHFKGKETQVEYQTKLESYQMEHLMITLLEGLVDEQLRDPENNSTAYETTSALRYLLRDFSEVQTWINTHNLLSRVDILNEDLGNKEALADYKDWYKDTVRGFKLVHKALNDLMAESMQGLTEDERQAVQMEVKLPLYGQEGKL